MGALWSRPDVVPRTEYTYPDPLPKGKIRLLENYGRLPNGWLSMSQERNSHYSLITVDLRHAPSFVAASYMWGSDKRTEAIFIDESYLLHVTASAKECLDVLSRHDYIWIDSICINQSNNEEKSQQVGLMGEIYSRASKVVGILGKTTANGTGTLNLTLQTDTLDSASWHLREYLSTKQRLKFSPYARDPPKAGGLSSIGMGNPRFGDLRAPPGHFEPPSLNTIQLSKLFSSSDSLDLVFMIKSQLECYSKTLNLLCHPYWQRVWIIQELALAKRVTIYYDGWSQTLDSLLSNVEAMFRFETHFFESWSSLSQKQCAPGAFARDAGTYLAVYQYVVKGRTTNPEPIFTRTGHKIFSHNLQLLRQIKTMKRHSNISLKDALIGTVASLATNPRDKVYALLGLVFRKDEDSDSSELRIKPDYEKSPEKVFEETTLALIKAGDPSTHLLGAGIGWDWEDRGMPSWVVDWSRHPSIFTKDVVRLKEYGAGFTHNPEDTENRNFSSIDSNKISGEFLRLDTIVFLSPRVSSRDSGWFHQCWNDIRLHVPEHYPHRLPTFAAMERHEALWRVLLDVPQVAQSKMPTTFNHDGSTTCELETEHFTPGFFQSHGVSHPCRALVDEAFKSWAGWKSTGGYDLAEAFEEALSRSESNGARIAVSSKGYLGSVPPFSTIGDEILVHLGCPMPIVVRETPRGTQGLRCNQVYRRLVGRAHFLGMMRTEWTRAETESEFMEAGNAEPLNVVLI